MPGTLQLVQVDKSPKRIQTFLVSNDEFMLVNPDIINSIYIGNDPGSQPIAVPALGSVTLDAKKHDIWVSTSGANYLVNAYLMPNGSNWVPSPAQVAQSISALGLAKETTLQSNNAITGNTNTILGSPAQTTDINGVVTTLGVPAQSTDINNLTVGGNPGGVPVLRGTSNLGSSGGSGISIGALVTQTLLNNVPITQPGFEAIFQFNLSAGLGTVPFGILTFNWSDSFSGLSVGQKSYVITGGSGIANAAITYLCGPCRGNLLTVTFNNHDPSVGSFLVWTVNQTSHSYMTDRLLQPTYTTVTGFTNAFGSSSRGLLASVTVTVAPNSNIIRLVAAYNGKVKVSLDNTAQLNAVALQINTPSSSGLYAEQGPPTVLLKLACGAGAQASSEWAMPNGPTTIQVFNQAATNNVTPNVAVTTMEY